MYPSFREIDLVLALKKAFLLCLNLILAHKQRADNSQINLFLKWVGGYKSNSWKKLEELN